MIDVGFDQDEMQEESLIKAQTQVQESGRLDWITDTNAATAKL